LPSFAYEPGARVLASGGATQVEGSAGGGVVPWAVISGYAQEGEWSAETFATRLKTDNYFFEANGVNFSFSNRLELSVAKQSLDISYLSSRLSLPDNSLNQTIYAAKYRLTGDLIYGTWPQLSLGIQHKKNTNFLIPSLVGAQDDKGTDYYLAASKLWVDGISGYPVLVNGTLRRTEANQLGLLGFGALDSSPDIYFETSFGIMPSRQFMIGADYRQKPDNLGFAEEQDWYDIFIAWFPNKRVSLTLAWADLGDVATIPNQDGLYFSFQGSF
jgi:hypothetical protein